MALKGTIKEIGIADIFQFLGQRTGVLVLTNDKDEVRVFFQTGSVVRAESKTRPHSQRLGMMMVEAEVITQAELDRALAEQARTLKKIGLVLVDLDLVSAQDVRDFAHLQMTDTVYSLFSWTDGTYEFHPADSVPLEDGVDPIRADGLLMEAMRMSDEWPLVKKRLPSHHIVPEKLKPLPDPESQESPDPFGLDPNAGHRPAEVEIGSAERKVYELLQTDRSVRQLINLSRLGEFETCRAILTLVDGGYVRLIQPRPQEEAPQKWRPGAFFLRVAACAALGVIGVVMLSTFDGRQLGLDLGSTLHYRESHFEGYLAETQLDVIRRALDVFRLQQGSYPTTLDELTEAGILRDRDLRYPFASTYYYRREGASYVLMPPLY